MSNFIVTTTEKWNPCYQLMTVEAFKEMCIFHWGECPKLEDAGDLYDTVEEALAEHPNAEDWT